jgi:hypothetical protein
MRLTWPVADRVERIFLMSASASIERIFIVDIAAEGYLMVHEGRARRRWYADDLKLRAPLRRNIAIVEAFAAVTRERFLGPGPWRILPLSRHIFSATTSRVPRSSSGLAAS